MNAARAQSSRLAHIAAVLWRHGLAHLIGRRLDRWPVLARRLPPGDLSGPERLRALIEDLGGTFVKFGQMLALQPDIIPFAYCNALFDLLDRIAPFEFAAVERIFAEEVGHKPAEIFDFFDPEPLATASVAQVHVAYLDGRKLAVKVQRPEVEANFAGDIRLMERGIRLIRLLRLRSLYWIVELLNEFITWTREELDFRCEARYMEQLRRNARDNETERIPEVVGRYTARRILVVEYLEGVTVLDCLRAAETGDELTLQRLRGLGFDPDVFARHIIDNFLEDAFRQGMFHADLHPANLIILPDNVVGYVDFGISAVLSPFARQKLAALTLAYTRADLDGMCAAFFEISTLDESSDIEAFRREIERFTDSWYAPRQSQRRLRKNFTLVMLDILALSRRTGILPEREVIKYIRSSIAADGLITRFAPEFDVGGYLESVCARHLRWQARQEAFSYDSLVKWSSSSGHLLHDGAGRLAQVLDRLAGGEWPVEWSDAVPQSDGALRTQAVYLAAVAFVAALLITLASSAEWGLNLFTAEVALGAVAGIQLLRTVHRLA